MTTPNVMMTEADFALLGQRNVAYVREVSREEAVEIARMTGLPVSGIKLYALHAADGTRMAVTDSIETARASALQHDLETVSVH